jgi:hypothetical protein
LLDIEDSAEEASSISVIIEEAIEARVLSGLSCPTPSCMGLGCGSSLPRETLIFMIDHRNINI